jgi:5'-3' exonuclease
MGINNLYKIIKKYSPESITKVNLNKFAYKKIGVDTNLYMYKYKVIFGEENWLRAFVNMICCFRKNEIHPIFIIDSKAPIEKQEEQKHRREQRQKLVEKLKLIENDYELYKRDGTITDTLKSICESDKKHPLLLITKNVFREDTIINKINTLKNQTISISKDDYDAAKKLFKVLHIPYFDATTEAEATCSYLNNIGKISAVLTEDTDVLAYGTNIFLNNINVHEETCMQINTKKLLKNLDMKQNEFTDMCIMCGTDYNKNIPKIGPIKSYNLIKEYKSIEEVEKNTKLDISILKHNRSRELFTFPEKYFEKKIYYCKPLDINEVQKFLFENNCRIDISYISDCFKPKELIFI